MLTMSDHVVLSLPIPCEEQPLSSKVVGFNNLVLSAFEENQNITVCQNVNFSYRGKIIRKFYESDGIHLTSNEGTRLLAGNLKSIILRGGEDTQAHRQGPQYERGRQRNWTASYASHGIRTSEQNRGSSRARGYQRNYGTRGRNWQENNSSGARGRNWHENKSTDARGRNWQDNNSTGARGRNWPENNSTSARGRNCPDDGLASSLTTAILSVLQNR